MTTNSPPRAARARAAIRGFNPFALVERLLTLAALVLVAITVGGQLGDMLGLTGTAGTIAAWSIALVYDALWIGALRMSEQAIRQRSRIGMTVMLGLSAVAVGVSTATLYVLGHAQVFAGVPIAAAVFMGLRLFADNVLADTATSNAIAKQSADDRNEAALTAAGARHLAAEAVTDVVTETAGHLAETRRQIARAETLTKAQIRLDKVRAKAEKDLAKADGEHGKAAAAFMDRPMAIANRPANPAAALRGTPAPSAAAQVTATSGALPAPAEAPSEPPAPTPASDTDDAVYPDCIDTDLLLDMARVARVDTPPIGEQLTDEQLTVVLRYLRHVEDPPASARKAIEAFRAAGFVGSEERVRKNWGALLSKEEALTTGRKELTTGK